MKRIISVLLIIALCFTLLCGCSNSKKRPFDYKLDKYITLGDYVGITYTYEVAEVTDEQITNYVNSALSEKGYATQQEVARAVQNGDTVNIDFKGTKNGVAFEGGTSEGYDLVIGSNSFIDGFESGLVGAKKGETRTLDLTFPENYGNEELNGQKVQFEVKINAVKATVYPDLTNEIVAELSDTTTVDEYIAYVNEQVKAQNEQTAINEMESEIWTKIVNNTKVISLPEKEVKNYKELILDSYDQEVQAQYQMSYEELLKAYGKTLDDIDPDLTKQAEQTVKEYMIVVAIARDQDIDISEEEYNKELANYATANGYSSAKEFADAIDESQFYLTLIINKVMDFVVENAVNESEK